MHTYDLRDWRTPVMTVGDDPKRVERSYLRYVGSGVEFFSMIAVTVLLGYWLDGHFDTTPALTIVFALVGFASATLVLVRSVFDANDPPADRDPKP